LNSGYVYFFFGVIHFDLLQLISDVWFCKCVQVSMLFMGLGTNLKMSTPTWEAQ